TSTAALRRGNRGGRDESGERRPARDLPPATDPARCAQSTRTPAPCTCRPVPERRVRRPNGSAPRAGARRWRTCAEVLEHAGTGKVSAVHSRRSPEPRRPVVEADGACQEWSETIHRRYQSNHLRSKLRKGRATALDEISFFWIPITAILGAFAYAILHTVMRARVRELEIRERIAMIERGLMPPPEVDPRGFDRVMHRLDRHKVRSGAGRHRRAGVTLMGVGFGLMVLIGFTARDAGSAIGVGGFLAVIGFA